MKTLKILSALAISAAVILSCSQGEKKSSQPSSITKAQLDSASYAVGVSLGSMLKQANFGQLNMTEVYKALEAVLAGDSLKINEMKANEVIQNFAMKRQAAIGDENKAAGEKFLAENGKKDSVVTTASGLQYKLINPGSEIKPLPEDTVEVHYKGTLIDGTEFDSSYSRNQPAKFPLNGVIKGWIEGLQLVGEGGKITLYLPSELAYGAQQAGPTITPNSTLIFNVELIKVYKAAVAPAPAEKAK